MKIIEEEKGWDIEERCTGKGNGNGGCNSLLLIEEGDLYLTSHADMCSDTNYDYTFRCLKCGRETDVEPKRIPYATRIELLRSELLDGKRKARTLHR